MANGIAELKAVRDQSPEWESKLATGRLGQPKPTLRNALIALRSAPEWHGVISFDEFGFRTVMQAAPPWLYTNERQAFEPRPWSDPDDTDVQDWLQKHGIEINRQTASQAIEKIAAEHPFHPVRDYLDNLPPWDLEPRADKLATRYLDTPAGSAVYANYVCNMWLRAAVARIMEPGCKADSALILEGPQGIGKSSALRELASAEWFTDSVAEVGSKDACLQMCGNWIVELAELDSIRRAEVSKIKAFLSRSTDKFRPPYGRRIIAVPRQCVIGGSTNDASIYSTQPVDGGSGPSSADTLT